MQEDSSQNSDLDQTVASSSNSSLAHKVDFTGDVTEVAMTPTSKASEGTAKTAEEFDVEAQRPSSSSPSKPTKPQQEEQNTATLTLVKDLSVYKGETLEEKIDSFIHAHPVVMFNKTWCLFSVDAQNFLLHQMNVSVHALEVDIHPQGKQILKHVFEITKFQTVPVIYIKGEFLGGFEDVNALYATGRLENEYLNGLTQADRCEEFIRKAQLTTQPYFWFPEKVNAHVVRMTGVLTCLASAASAVLVHWHVAGRYIAYALFADFFLRLLAGSKISPTGRLATLLVCALEPKPRAGRPKQFATCCGIIFSGMGTMFYLLGIVPYHDIIGAAFMGGLACASGMEGFFDFCLGCVFFKYGVKLGLIRK